MESQKKQKSTSKKLTWEQLQKSWEEDKNLTDEEMERKYMISVPGMLSKEWD